MGFDLFVVYLFDMTVKSTVLIALALVAVRSWMGLSPAWRSMIWTGMLATLPVLPLASGPLRATDEKMDTIITHELAHLVRGDTWWHRLYILPLTICFLLATPAYAFQNKPDHDQRYTAALEQANRLQFNEAMDILRGILYEDPLFAVAHVRLADIHQHQWARDFVNARREADLAESLQVYLSPSDRLLLEAVQAKLDQRINDALDALQARTEQWPSDRQVLFDMAEAAFYTGNRPVAIDFYQKLLTQWPDYTPALNHLAYSIPPEEGILMLEKAVAAEPKEPNWYDSLGDLYRATGRADDAIEQYQKAVHVDPAFTVAWGKLAGYYVSKNRLDEAVAAYTQQVAFAPAPAERANACNTLWTLRIQQEGKTPAVLSDIRRELADLEASGGDNPDVLVVIARGYRLIGDAERAKQVEDAVDAVDPNGMQIQMLRLQASDEIKDHQERAVYLEAFRKNYPQTTYTEIVLMDLFSAYSHFATNDKIRETADELLQVAQYNTESAKQTIATAFANRRMALDRAETLANEAMTSSLQRFEMMKNAGAFDTVEPEELQAREIKLRASSEDTKGWVALAQGRIDVAETLLRSAYKATEAIHATGPDQLYHLGVLAELQQTPDEATTFYLRTVTQDHEHEKAREAFITLAAQQGKSTADVENMIESWRKQAVQAESKRLLADRLNAPAPNFSLKTLDGKTITLSDLKGKVVLIDFWATWCFPCKLQLPLYETVHNKFKDQDIVCLAISVDGQMTQGEVGPFNRDNTYTFQVLLDVNDLDTKQAYNVQSIPTLFVIDKAGNIQYKHVGYKKNLMDLLSRQIERLQTE